MIRGLIPIDPSQTYLCQYCQQFQCSYQCCNQCLAAYCNDCIPKIHNNKCLKCQYKLQLREAPQQQVNIIMGTKVYCKNKPYGCTHICPVEQYPEHLATCKYHDGQQQQQPTYITQEYFNQTMQQMEQRMTLKMDYIIKQLNEKQQEQNPETNTQQDFISVGKLVDLPQTFGCKKDHVLKFWTGASMNIYRKQCSKCNKDKICRYACASCQEYCCLQCVPIQMYVDVKNEIKLCAAQHPIKTRFGYFVCDICNIGQPTTTSIVCYDCDFDICQNCIKARNYIAVKI